MAKIIIVDDDHDSAYLVEAMLSDRHDVTVRHSAKDAMELLVKEHYDVLVSDLKMPEHDGFQLIQAARKLRPDLPTVVMSAYYDETDPLAHQMAKRYADVILPKPFPADAIRGAVTQLTSMYRI